MYHVTTRGNGRQAIFLDDRDREHFLLRLRDAVHTYQVRLYLFCLMTNHVHLIVETPLGNLSRFMQAVLTSHVTYFNRRHDRVGHVLQGRFSAKLVSTDEYLLRLTRYVHLNPVFTADVTPLLLAKRVEELRQYRWSSYPGYIDRSRRVAFVDYEPVLGLVAAGRRRPEEAYRTFVEEGLVTTDEEFREILRCSAKGIGRGTLQERTEPRAEIKGRGLARPEEFSRGIALVEPGRVLSTVAKAFGQSVQQLTQRQRGHPARAVAAMMLCRYAGRTQRETAAPLSLRSNAAVSIQLRALRRQMEKDRALREKVAVIEKMLRRKP